MSKASPAIGSMNAGELSPKLGARVDFAKYPAGASLLENMIPTVQGPLERRGGTRFVHEVKDPTSKVLLQPFEYSVDQAYMLEFGNLYCRFYTWDATTKVRGILETFPGSGIPVEVVTPYTTADLYNADGTPRLRFAQSGDNLYIAHGLYQQRTITRTSATSFAIALFAGKGGPWADLNETATTVYASAETGAGITLTASSAIFTANMVGSLFYMESKDLNAILPWEVSKAVVGGDRRRSDAKTYEVSGAGGTTGTAKPVHTSGALSDGGALWEYRDPGYGYVRITGFTSTTVVTADVVDRLPNQVVLVANATTRWAFAEWSAVNGWPTDVAFFRERLWWGRKQYAWGSVAADFTDYSPLNYGQVTDDMAMRVTLVSGKINDVQWMIGDEDLLCGTAGGEFSVGELQNGKALGPGNVRCKLISAYGSRAIPPIKNGEGLLFVQRAGLKAREVAYDTLSFKYKSTDATVLAEHITASGLVQMTFTQEPNPVVWSIRADGKLLGFTWNAEQEVRGWHRHPIGGDGFVECVASMPAAEGDRSELWLVVKRTINGVTKRYVEYMERPWRDGDAQASSFYMDSGLTYTGAPVDVISGLGHLEGMVVDVLADGAPHPQCTVTAGSITLLRNASKVSIGLPCPCKYRSMRLEAGGADGTSQGKTKRIHKAVLRFLNTGGGRYGSTDDNMDALQLRSASDLMGAPVPLFSGDKVVPWPEGYNTDAYMQFINDQPTPVTLLGLMPQIVTQDAR
jgi:hypothetical protein